MRQIKTTVSGDQKLIGNKFELKIDDVESSIKSFHPGEWVEILISTKDKYIGHVNQDPNSKSVLYVISKINENLSEPFDFLETSIRKAVAKRNSFFTKGEGRRLIYGENDQLCGLVVDEHFNMVIAQISLSGIDLYREKIKLVLEELTNKKCYFLPSSQSNTLLPRYEVEPIPEVLVNENDIQYSILPEAFQKVGFYYDHRTNREMLSKIMIQYQSNFKIGLDLFCYVGAWSMNMLRGGLEFVEMVDQGKMDESIKKSMVLNKYNQRHKFIRDDVYKYLDKQIGANKLYDVICSDPPAFAKSESKKQNAIDGYSKLHQKLFKLIRDGGIIAFSSCTHYLNYQEFEKTILAASQKTHKKLQLLYWGNQGIDHPVHSSFDKSYYIKTLIYLVE